MGTKNRETSSGNQGRKKCEWYRMEEETMDHEKGMGKEDLARRDGKWEEQMRRSIKE